jgi:single-strand DNA-binding protein
MSQDNHITLRGYLTSEPKFRQTALTATPVTEIRLGSTPRRLDRETGEWQDLPTTYYTVKCWRQLAVNASSSLKKGDTVVVRGRFYTRTWLDSQQRRQTAVEIEADTLGHDLSYGWSRFLRGSRPSPGGSAAVNAGEATRQNPEEASGEPAQGDPGEYAGSAFDSNGPTDQEDPRDPGDSAGPDYQAGPDYPDSTADQWSAMPGGPAGGDDGVPGAADALDPALSSAKSDAPGELAESASF